MLHNPWGKYSGLCSGVGGHPRPYIYLKVNDFVPCLSDCHCLIQWSISAKYSNEHVHIENCNTIETSPGYKWSDESSFLFQEALSSPELIA